MGLSRFLCSSLIVLWAASSTVAQEIGQSKAKLHDGVSATWTGYWTRNKQRATGGSAGSTTTAVGQVVTLEKRVSSAFEVGFDLTFEEQEQLSDATPAGFSLPPRLAKSSSELNGFVRYSRGPLTIEPNLRVGIDDYELRRPDIPTGLTGNSKSNGYHWGAYLEMSVLLPISSNLFIRPTVDFDYSELEVDAFTEGGAGPANIAFEQVTDRRSVGQIGMAVGGIIPLAEIGVLKPFVSVKYRHNFITGPVQTRAKLASGAADLGQQTLSSGQEQSGVVVDVGTILTGRKNAELWAVYRGTYFPTATKHGLGTQFKLTF